MIPLLIRTIDGPTNTGNGKRTTSISGSVFNLVGSLFGYRIKLRILSTYFSSLTCIAGGDLITVYEKEGEDGVNRFAQGIIIAQ
jgi:hypothetical protein